MDEYLLYPIPNEVVFTHIIKDDTHISIYLLNYSLVSKLWNDNIYKSITRIKNHDISIYKKYRKYLIPKLVNVIHYNLEKCRKNNYADEFPKLVSLRYWNDHYV